IPVYRSRGYGHTDARRRRAGRRHFESQGPGDRRAGSGRQDRRRTSGACSVGKTRGTARMTPAATAVQRPARAKLLAVDNRGRISHWPRHQLVHLLRARDVVIANDGATLPASLFGRHLRTGGRVEVRLAQRKSLEGGDVQDFTAVAFGEGDFRLRTE